MASYDPGDRLEEVVDLKSFLAFVGSLIDDRIADVAKQRDQPIDPFGRGPKGWENHSIEDFLDAALRWAQTTRMGQKQGLPEAASWKAFAVFLYCGKIYE